VSKKDLEARQLNLLNILQGNQESKENKIMVEHKTKYRQVVRIVSLFLAVILSYSITAQADENPLWVQQEVVNCGSLPSRQDFLAAGFGTTIPGGEFQFSFVISQAKGDIVESLVYPPIDVIWTRGFTDESCHSYASQGSPEANAYWSEFWVKINRTEEGFGTGTEIGDQIDEWSVVVSDIDLDCDSDDNGLVANNRAPSRNEEEEYREDIDPRDYNQGSNYYFGMLLDPNLTGDERWAKLVLTLRARSDGELVVSLPTGHNGDFEMSSTVGGTIVSRFDETITLEPYDGESKVIERIYYVRPKNGIASYEQVRIAATFTPSIARTGNHHQGKSQDSVLVSSYSQDPQDSQGSELRMYINNTATTDDDHVPCAYKTANDMEKSPGDRGVVQSIINADLGTGQPLFAVGRLTKRIRLTIKAEGPVDDGDVTVLLSQTSLSDNRLPVKDRKPRGKLSLWSSEFGDNENTDKITGEVVLIGDDNWEMDVWIEAEEPGEVKIQATTQGCPPFNIVVPLLSIKANIYAMWGAIKNSQHKYTITPFGIDVYPSKYRDRVDYTLKWKYAENNVEYPDRWGHINTVKPELQLGKSVKEWNDGVEWDIDNVDWAGGELDGSVDDVMLCRLDNYDHLGISNKYGDMKMLVRVKGILCDYKDFMACDTRTVEWSAPNDPNDPVRSPNDGSWPRTAPGGGKSIHIMDMIYPGVGYPEYVRKTGIDGVLKVCPDWITMRSDNTEYYPIDYQIEALQGKRKDGDVESSLQNPPQDVGSSPEQWLALEMTTERDLTDAVMEASYFNAWQAYHKTGFYTRIGNLAFSDEVGITEQYKVGDSPTITQIKVVRGCLPKADENDVNEIRQCVNGNMVVLRAIVIDVDATIGNVVKEDTFSFNGGVEWKVEEVRNEGAADETKTTKSDICFPPEGMWTVWVPTKIANGDVDYFGDVQVTANDSGMFYDDNTEGYKVERIEVIRPADLARIEFSHTITVNTSDGAPVNDTEVQRKGSTLEVLGGGQTITVNAESEDGNLNNTLIKWYCWNYLTQQWVLVGGESDEKLAWTLKAKAPGDEGFTTNISVETCLPSVNDDINTITTIMNVISMLGLNELKLGCASFFL